MQLASTEGWQDDVWLCGTGNLLGIGARDLNLTILSNGT